MNGEWHKNDTLTFSDIVGSEDSNPLDLFIGVRYNADYLYKELWLQIVAFSDEGMISCDTLCCDIFDGSGHRKGTTAGAIYQAEFFAGNVQIPHDKDYKLQIAPLTTDSVLHGIYDIGIRLAIPCQHPHEEK